MAATSPNHVNADTFSSPPQIIQEYKIVTVCTYVIYVNKISFITYIARDLKFVTGKIVVKNKFKTQLGAIQTVVITYKYQCFTVHDMLTNN